MLTIRRRTFGDTNIRTIFWDRSRDSASSFGLGRFGFIFGQLGLSALVRCYPFGTLLLRASFVGALPPTSAPFSCFEACKISVVAARVFFEACINSVVAARRLGCARSPVRCRASVAEFTFCSGGHAQRPKATCTAVYVLNVNVIAEHGHAACVACVHMKPHIVLTPFVSSTQCNFAPQARFMDKANVTCSNNRILLLLSCLFSTSKQTHFTMGKKSDQLK